MSKSRRRIRAELGSAVTRWARVTAILVTGVAVITTALAAPASAYWTSTGSGSTSATTGTLSPPTDVTVPLHAAPDIPVSWTPGSGGAVPEGYFVTRSIVGMTEPACGSSPTELIKFTEPIDVPTCTDMSVPDGIFNYVVTAVYATWTAESEQSGTVIVENAFSLEFVGQPEASVAGMVISPAVSVALRSAGSPFQSAGFAVTIAIKNDQGDGILTGTTTVVTDTHGVATFDDLSIIQDGEYTLTATSPAVPDPEFSDSFSVLASNAITFSGDTFSFSQALPPTPTIEGGAAATTTPPSTGTAPPGNSVAVPIVEQRPNPDPVNLGAAAHFAVLATTSASSTGATVVNGDMGVSPGSTVTGFPDGVVNGTSHQGDTEAANAQSALAAAITEVTGRTPHTEITADLGGQTIHHGIHHENTSMSLTGTVTLDAENNPDAIFIFVTDAAFITADHSTVMLTNGAQADNVYWVVGDAARTGAGANHSGSILAIGAITLGEGTQLTGRALSGGAVTLAVTMITRPGFVPVGAQDGSKLDSPADNRVSTTTDETDPVPPTETATPSPSTNPGTSPTAPTAPITSAATVPETASPTTTTNETAPAPTTPAPTTSQSPPTVVTTP